MAVIAGWSVGAVAAGLVLGSLGWIATRFSYVGRGYQENSARWAQLSVDEKRAARQETVRVLRRGLLWLGLPILAGAALLADGGKWPDPFKLLIALSPVVGLVAIYVVAEWNARR